MITADWKQQLKNLANPEKAKILAGFFKTGKGEYGEGDIFLGVTVPQNREVAKKFFVAPLDQFVPLLHSEIHEFRLSALIALVLRYKKYKDEASRKEIVDFYLANTTYINNWDLVDLSCTYILGDYLMTRPHDLLFELSNSTNMWKQRIAIVSTLAFVRNGEFATAISLAEKYLNHTHDLIHKATVGYCAKQERKTLPHCEHFLTHTHHKCHARHYATPSRNYHKTSEKSICK